MNDTPAPPAPDRPEPDKVAEDLRARAEAAEAALATLRVEADARLIRAQMKAEALRAGMVDLDGLKLLDLSAEKLTPAGEVDGAAALMARLRRDKPWLFTPASSSSTAAAPPAAPGARKQATEMTDAEYRAARADLLKRRF